jgi:histone H3/H4
VINIPKCEVCGKNLKNPESKSHINSKYHQDALKKLKTSKSKPKKKKKAALGNATFAWAPIRRLMKIQGAQIVAKDAVDLLIDHLQNKVMDLTTQAQKFTNHANRKKITRQDLLLALKYQ